MKKTQKPTRSPPKNLFRCFVDVVTDGGRLMTSARDGRMLCSNFDASTHVDFVATSRDNIEVLFFWNPVRRRRASRLRRACRR